MSLPYIKHSDTSRRAAEDFENAESLVARTYRWLRKQGKRGATDEEIQSASGMNPSTQRPRRIELVDQLLVFDSGNKRLTKSGRKAVVWVARGYEEHTEPTFEGM